MICLYSSLTIYQMGLFVPALKIHVSSQSRGVLEPFGTFDLELRGEVEMKVHSPFD